MAKKKKQSIFYADVPKAGKYKPFVTKAQTMKIAREYVKSKKKKK